MRRRGVYDGFVASCVALSCHHNVILWQEYEITSNIGISPHKSDKFSYSVIFSLH